MDANLDCLTGAERAGLALRALYRSWGFSQYRMNKFEEYDLYAQNRDVLAAEQILSFTGPDGRLMALKPDVTLSIVRNTRDSAGGVRKLYYSEKVYRAERGGPFRELSQVGLECLGELDDCTLTQVLLLAAESLRLLAPGAPGTDSPAADWLLAVSQPDLTAQLLDRAGLNAAARAAAWDCIAKKTPHELRRVCREAGASEESAGALERLLRCTGSPAEVLPVLRGLCCGGEALEGFSRILAALERLGLGERLLVDFSAAGELDYYNGLVFRGYVGGVPDAVLSGGRYDRLLERFGRRDRAAGFAVSLDLLERLWERPEDADCDLLLRYGPGADPAALAEAVRARQAAGARVDAQRAAPDGLRYGRMEDYAESGVGTR